MATPELQRRTAEITRILAANGWGVVAIRDEGAAITVTARKPLSAIRGGTVNDNLAALRFLVTQFRWEVIDYQATPDHHRADVTSL